MEHGAEHNQVEAQLQACLRAIRQVRQALPAEQVVAVDLGQLETAFAVQDRSRPTVPCFAVRA